MLAINAKSANVAAAWKLIQYLTSPSVEIARARRPATRRRCRRPTPARCTRRRRTSRQVKTLNGYAQPRPVSPNYLQISVDLQNAFSAVFANIELARVGDDRARRRRSSRSGERLSSGDRSCDGD